MKGRVFCIIGLILLFGCSDSTGPGDGGNGNGSTPVSATIGIAGGSIHAEALSLTVPPGTFDTDHTITLSESPEQDGNTHAVTPVFLISGLPAFSGAPVVLAVRPQSPLAEESFIALGREHVAGEDGSPTVVYEFFPATAEGDTLLVAAVPADAAILNAPVGAAAARPAFLNDALYRSFGISNQDKKHESSQRHFSFTYPANTRAAVLQLADHCEDIYRGYTDLGFTMLNNLFGPGKSSIGLWVTQMKETTGPVLCQNNFTLGTMLYVNEWRMTTADKTDMYNTMSRELFLAIPYYLDNHSDVIEHTHFWFHRAAAIWAARQVTDRGVGTDDVPEEFPGHETAPFSGMAAGSLGSNFLPGSIARAHGDGMTALLFSLLSPERYGPSLLKATYDLVAPPHEEPPATALIQAIGDPPAVWLPAFFRDYISGGVFDVGRGTFMDVVQGTFAVDDASDTLGVFPISSPDLSAALFRIDLNYGAIDSSATLNLEATGDLVDDGELTLLLFKDLGGVLTPLDTADDNILNIADVRMMTQGGWDLVVAVVNSHFRYPDCTSVNDVSLKMKIEQPPQTLPHTKGTIVIAVHGHYDNSNSGSFDSLHFREFHGVGGFEGGTFTAAWDTTKWGDDSYRGMMTVVLDPSLTEVDHFVVGDTLATENYTIINRIEGQLLPIADLGGWQLGFEVTDAAACASVLDLRYSYESPPNDFSEQLVGYDCTTYTASGHRITITFMKDNPLE